jgi:hypothetical protein
LTTGSTLFFIVVDTGDTAPFFRGNSSAEIFHLRSFTWIELPVRSIGAFAVVLEVVWEVGAGPIDFEDAEV